MAKIDEIKEYIGFLKAIFITMIIIDTSLVAYLYKKTFFEDIYVLVTIIFVTIIVLMLFKKILKEIKSLGEL